MWELDYKESWVPKNWFVWTVVLEKTFDSPLDCKEILPVHPKGNRSWIFIGRTDAEADTPILWPPDAESWLIWKDPDTQNDWRQEEKGTTDDKMVGWHHRPNADESELALAVCDGQGGLACCSPWARKELDMTEWLIWTELKWSPKVLTMASCTGEMSNFRILSVKEGDTAFTAPSPYVLKGCRTDGRIPSSHVVRETKSVLRKAKGPAR